MTFFNFWQPVSGFFRPGGLNNLIPILLIMGGIQLSGCVSVFKPIHIDDQHISTASFSCVAPGDCWAFTDGDVHNTISGTRRGFLELQDDSWVRKSDWRNWYSATNFDPQESTSTDLFILDRERGWLVIDGRLYKKIQDSFDGGWEFAPTPFCQDAHTDGTVTEVFFTNGQYGWVLSTTGEIAHTRDGGDNWASFSIELGNSHSALFFQDSLTGWVVADNTYLLQTYDGGMHWQRVSFLTVPGKVTQLRFGDTQHAWMVIDGLALPAFSNDGGLTWVQPIQESRGLQSVYYWNSLQGWAIQPGKGIVHTIDGGKTWVHQDISDSWIEHPANMIWKTPLWVIGTLFQFLASIFHGWPETSDHTPPLFPIFEI